MRIAEYKQIDERIKIIHHEATYDEEGNILTEAYDEEKHIPIMGMVYRDMSPEEIAELPREEPQEEPTTEERLGALETTTDDIVLMLADIIGGE